MTPVIEQLMDQLKFTQADFEAAHDAWFCNCGPSALACALGITLDDVRPLLGDFEQKRYTSPTMMKDALQLGGYPMREITRSRKIMPTILPEPLPARGLVRVQWSGPWTAPGANPRWAYRYTHWIASFNTSTGCYVFDCNGGMRAYESWEAEIVPLLIESVPKADGEWWATHLWELC